MFRFCYRLLTLCLVPGLAGTGAVVCSLGPRAVGYHARDDQRPTADAMDLVLQMNRAEPTSDPTIVNVRSDFTTRSSTSCLCWPAIRRQPGPTPRRHLAHNELPSRLASDLTPTLGRSFDAARPTPRPLRRSMLREPRPARPGRSAEARAGQGHHRRRCPRGAARARCARASTPESRLAQVVDPFRKAASRVTGPLRRYLGRMNRSLQMAIAFGIVLRRPLETAGVLSQEVPRDIFDEAYRLYWWLVFVIVFVLPTYPEEPFFYFPAILALAVAWVLAMHQYGQSLLSADFEVLRPPPGSWATLVKAIQSRRVEVPPEVTSDQAAAEVDATLLGVVPSVTPLVLLQIIYKLSARAIAVAVVGLVGLLVGPLLAHVHWLLGWSPVALLYAVTAPWAALLLVSLILPLLIQTFVSGLKASKKFDELSSTPDQSAPSEPAAKPRRRTAKRRLPEPEA